MQTNFRILQSKLFSNNFKTLSNNLFFMAEENKKSEYGDFEEIKTEEQIEKEQLAVQQAPSRIRLPRQGQLAGKVLTRLGGKRMSIKTTDGKTRNCRVPGRFSRRFWLRPGNFVIIEPWADDDDKGDVVYQYRKNEISQLKKRIDIKTLDEEF
jgi:translation initiation factor 1A